MCSLWISLQPYSYSNFGGIMIPQMPVNYAQNAYAYQVRMHTHPHTPISQQHPVQGLPGTAHMLLHVRWRVQPGLEPPVPTYPALHTPPSLWKRLVWVFSVAPCLTADPSPQHAVHSTSLDSGPEDTACQSGDLHLVGLWVDISVITVSFETMQVTCQVRTW